MGRIILHVDMNCYFVSCEIADKKSLVNLPIAVAPRGKMRRGIILTASYAARKFGITSGMLVTDALKKCKDLILLEPHYEKYEAYSKKFCDYFRSITNLVEVASIDEAFLDVTDVCNPEDVYQLAIKIQQDLLKNLDLPCSIGIGPNKFLAKMGSDYQKPLGITVMRKREVEKMLWPLPVENMIGVGKRTFKNLQFLKIKTIGDLANYPDKTILVDILGKNTTEYLLSRANGEGDSVVDPKRFSEFSSISTSHTFEVDLFDPSVMKDYLKLITKQLVNRLEMQESLCNTVSIHIRYNDFHQILRSKSLYEPTDDFNEIYNLIKDLFDDYYDERIPVRLLGASLSKLSDKKNSVKQMSIFDDLSKEEKDLEIKNLVGNINKSLGKDSLTIGINNLGNKDNNE